MEEIYKRRLWERGRGLDLWSVPHFLFGILGAMLPQLFGISSLTAFALVVICALLWEVYEKLANIRETVLNSLFDIILSILGFTIASLLLLAYPLEIYTLQIVAAALFGLYMGINILGWFAHLKRKSVSRPQRETLP
ncbi:TPA: hypothetical protein DIV48_02430 [Candidatus Kaiserbacteria bacterium]|nr:MAG: hypothetical protein UY93_C0002G0263 [Parcubacteria group bacterium GW2011_GWA1_56_13]KKW46487.1 MAG: hypothetical protein UY97_C0005G0032 [Parcubacteria group bacterium GW2011_GWB1_57_6]HCR52484.1 hypothetical protein [Candidatus Kaiserbacteria bacterium]